MAGKKILIIASEFPPDEGGIGNHAYHLAKALHEEGYAVTVICDVIKGDRQQLKSFASNEGFKIVWIRRSRVVPVTYLKRIGLAVYLSSTANCVICSGKFPLWTAILIKWFTGIANMVAVVHGSELDIKNHFAKSLTNRALFVFKKIVAVSAYTRQYLPVPLQTDQFTTTIPNGIRLQQFAEYMEHKTAINGQPAIITVGSVTERKGQQNVINALPAISKVYANVHYHMVGKPVNKPALETLANQLQVSDRITFYGAVSRQQLLTTLASARIKLMLSIHTAGGDFEGFGIAVLEANALGIPVIGSRNSGIADAIADGKTGFLVNPLDANEIVEKIQKIEADYDFFSQHARQWAQQHGWKNIVKKYIAVIEK